MKKILPLIILLLCQFGINSQTIYEDCNYIHDTRTNPLDQLNAEFLNFPWSSTVTVNSFLNTGFNWYNNPDDAIKIAVVSKWQQNLYTQFQQGSFNDYYSMFWPWHRDMRGADFLHEYAYYPNGDPNEEPNYNDIEEEDRDFRWEDGWELLWMNLGYLPNGIKNDRNKIINVHRI